MSINIPLLRPRGYLQKSLVSWLGKTHQFRYKDLIVPQVTLKQVAKFRDGSYYIAYSINGKDKGKLNRGIKKCITNRLFFL